MTPLDHYLDQLLSHGRSYFSKEEALKTLGGKSESFSAAATRLIKKGRLVSPWRGFYLILRPEDRIAGAPDPARWIDPLMHYLGLDYRISLLRAAAFHGSSHQASMVFQVIAPKQLRSFDLGRHRIQFIYQDAESFRQANNQKWLQQLKTESGFAQVAGVELTLLDSARYFHKAGGINGVAQIVHDVGSKAQPRALAEAAATYENSAVRRLGYLLEYFGHSRQAKVLLSFVKKAKSLKPLDPSITPLFEEEPDQVEKNIQWMLTINEPVEIDA
jgi:predicted transcriptional regulator of viral defense system